MKIQDLLYTRLNYFTRCNYNSSSKDITLSEWISELPYEDYPNYKQNIDDIRHLRQSNNSEYKTLKSQNLPCVCFTGHYLTYRGKGKEDYINPIICVDIDGQDNPNITDWYEIKEQVMQLPYVFFTSLSCSGSGIYCLVCIDLSVVKSYKDVYYMYKSLEEDFKTNLDIVIDSACSDSSRVRFLSYDPDYKIKKTNVDIQTYNKTKIPSNIHNNQSYTSKLSNWKWSDDFVYKSVYYLIMEDKYQSNNYSSWLRDCWRLCWLGDKGHMLFMLLSEKSDKYDKYTAENQFKLCYEKLNPEICNKSDLCYYFSLLKKNHGSQWRQIIENYNIVKNLDWLQSIICTK